MISNMTTLPSVSDSIYPESTVDVISLGVFLALMTVITIGGNLLVILAVCMVKKLRTPSNFLIVSLAVSDLLVGLIAMPFAEFKQLVGTWPLGEALCDMYIAFDVLLCTASILNLCAISIDRYLAITRPLQYAAKRTPKRMTLMIASVWVASALISIPPMFGFKETFVPGFCEYSSNFIYQIYATCGAFYIPLIVMIVLYGRIFILARRMAQEDAKQKRVTDSVVNQNSSTTYTYRNGRNSLRASDDFKTTGEQLDLVDTSMSGNTCVNKDRPKTVNNADESKSVKGKPEKYPLPPSELCRRRKPRLLYRKEQPQHPISSHSQLEETQLDMKNQSEAKPQLNTIQPQNSACLSCAEEFEERIRTLRKLRAEFFAAPPSRHCSSVILNFKQDTDLSYEPGNRPNCTESVSILNKPNEHRTPLHHSYTVYEPANNMLLSYNPQCRSSMPPPPQLSISYCSEDNCVNENPANYSVASNAWTNSEHGDVQNNNHILLRSDSQAHQILLRPKQRPLHGARRSMTNAAEFANKVFPERCSFLGLPTRSGDRRRSSPMSTEQYGWSNGMSGSVTCDSPDHQPSCLERSTSRLFHRTSEQPLLPQVRSRTTSWASIRVPLRKRRGRGHSETKAIKTLGVIMGCFCLCWLPFFILALARPMHKVVTGVELNVPPVVDSLFLWLGYINSTINPIIYAIFNREFRIPFKEILICRCRGINARLRSQRFAVEYGGIGVSTASAMGNIYGPNDTVSYPFPNAAKRRSNTQTNRKASDNANNNFGNVGRTNTGSVTLGILFQGRQHNNVIQR